MSHLHHHVEIIQILGVVNTLMEYVHATSKAFNFEFSTFILYLSHGNNFQDVNSLQGL
jgi:hypothetical protein